MSMRAFSKYIGIDNNNLNIYINTSPIIVVGLTQQET